MDVHQSQQPDTSLPEEPQYLENDNDIEYSKPSKSRFLFLLFFFGFFVFAWAGCANLWEHRWQPNDDVKIPENTTYDPKYTTPS